MRLKAKSINEESFDFKKIIPKKQIKKKITLFSLIIPILFLDIIGTTWSLNSQTKEMAEKATEDFNNYKNLLNLHYQENKETKNKIEADTVKKSFDNFKPQTEMGQLLLLNEMVYYKNEYFKINTNSLINEKTSKEIIKHIDNTIKKEDFISKNESFKCTYHVTCYLLKYSLQDKLTKNEDSITNLKRKKFFELSHKKEMQEFYKLPFEIRNKLLQEKQDPISKNFW